MTRYRLVSVDSTVPAGTSPIADGLGSYGWGSPGGVKVNLAYGTTVTPNLQLGTWQSIIVTNTTAFSIAAALNPPLSTGTAELTIEVFNNSGGIMGAITWNGIYLFPTGSWTNPASTKHRFARFEWNGANWIAIAVATSDY